MKVWNYEDNDKCTCCLTKAEKIVQHIFKCKEPGMKAYEYELCKHIYLWLKEQDTQQMLLDMIMVTIL